MVTQKLVIKSSEGNVLHTIENIGSAELVEVTTTDVPDTIMGNEGQDVAITKTITTEKILKSFLVAVMMLLFVGVQAQVLTATINGRTYYTQAGTDAAIAKAIKAIPKPIATVPQTTIDSIVKVINSQYAATIAILVANQTELFGQTANWYANRSRIDSLEKKIRPTVANGKLLFTRGATTDTLTVK